MKKACAQCSAAFEILDEDLQMLKEISPKIGNTVYDLPPPTLCPQCRYQRRLCWRGERTLYHRSCDATQKKIISNYSTDKPFPVFDKAYWFGDDWDRMEYGRDFDFSKPFFDQFKELQGVIPRFVLQQQQEMENSDYCNFASNCKDCYLIFDSDFCRDCLYGNVLKHCEDCIDCSFISKCELCYECIDCKKCYKLKYSKNCDNCSNSVFLENCIGCKNCAFSINLQNSEYIFANKQMTKEEYEEALANMHLESNEKREMYQKEYPEYCVEHIQRYMQGTNNENVSGDHIYNSKNVFNSFNVEESWDIRHCDNLIYAKDCMDVSSFGEKIERIYSTTTAGLGSQNCYFCFTAVINAFNNLYCDTCYACKNCFGCIGLYRNEYCILNKQYTKEEYESLVGKIITHMEETGEWGEFFPINISPFDYNETVAMDFFPLTKEEVKESGWRWHNEEDVHDQYMGPAVTIPDSIDDVEEDITKAILSCKETDKQYKISPKELEFCRSQNIPVPHICPDQRHRLRMQRKEKRQLWARKCGKCKKDIQTTFAPDRPETVYCEPCYLQTVR